MDVSQELTKCIQDCERASQELRRMAGKADDPVIRTNLLDSARHAELSARECRFGLDMASLEKTPN